MILHLVSDDKFADYAISQFESVAPNQNKYVLLTAAHAYTAKYIKRIDKIAVVNIHKPEFEELCNNMIKYKVIVMHNMNMWYAMHKFPPAVPIAWVVWVPNFTTGRKI